MCSVRPVRFFTIAFTVVFAASASSLAFARELSFDERVAAQKAIEQVYWSHRIWPKENSAPKPPLSSVIPDEAIRTKVKDYIEKSNALEADWQRPITGAQLQAELNRMARSSKKPEMLRELFEALGNDPFLIAETLVRQKLAERLVRERYARDERYHGELRARAQALLSAGLEPAKLNELGAVTHDALFVRAEAGDGHRLLPLPGQDTKTPLRTALDPDEWERAVVRLAETFGVARGRTGADVIAALPVGTVSPLREEDDRFTVTSVLRKANGELTIREASWLKRGFDRWWAAEREALAANLVAPAQNYKLPQITATECQPDAWAATRGPDVPEARDGHTVVWTGSEMIVWGGNRGELILNTGGRYDPVADTWTPTSTGANVPGVRSGHTAVWTGSEMIVWGGYGGDIITNFRYVLKTGGRYDPVSDTWTPTSTGANVASPRTRHTAVWTGSEMIVWGGVSDNGTGGISSVNTGGRYDPLSDTWTPTSTGENVPSPRWQHTAVWTGSEMIVWGGDSGNGTGGSISENTGSRYDPLSDTWTPTSTGPNVPAARTFHTAIWTGSEMIVWGGYSYPDTTSTGGRYDPLSDSWTPTSTGPNVPSPSLWHTAVWTGSEMIVWGGFSLDGSSIVNTGGRYDPVSDRWMTTSLGASVPSARQFHTAVWTGSEMIVWGGDANLPVNTGGRYDPVSDRWTPTGSNAVPSPRSGHAAVWTGSEMIIFGGIDEFGRPVSRGGRYDLASDTWAPTPTEVTAGPTPVWSGSEIISWNGYSGGRYDPVLGTWTPIATGPTSPDSGAHFTAVWTGSEMIVWGGQNGSEVYMNTGSRYDPVLDRWTRTSTGGSVPSGRGGHTAVWTGSEMIVWGGRGSGGILSTGGRYDPRSDSWLRTSSGANVPSARELHTAVWTGSEMIVWGSGLYPVSTGGRYDPRSDRWTPTSTGANVPSPRTLATAVWTGSEMIIWGGFSYYDYLSTGSRYDPSLNIWSPMAAGANSPSARSGHTAVWTGSEMVVWGGGVEFEIGTADYIEIYTDSGGRYCAPTCLHPTTSYLDQDHDGFGVPTATIATCDASIPAGYAGNNTDCDDSVSSIHPGAVEVCNGLDDNCNGSVDEGLPDVDVDGTLDCVDNCPDVYNPEQDDVCSPATLCSSTNLDKTGFSSGRVDGRDLAAIAEAWNSCPDDSRYDSAANLDRVPTMPGACVDASDFHVFMQSFGRSCP